METNTQCISCGEDAAPGYKYCPECQEKHNAFHTLNMRLTKARVHNYALRGFIEDLENQRLYLEDFDQDLLQRLKKLLKFDKP